LRRIPESEFSADKRMMRWSVSQRKDDMIDRAIFCNGLRHSLFNIGRSYNRVSLPNGRII
jgi:transposase